MGTTALTHFCRHPKAAHEQFPATTHFPACCPVLAAILEARAEREKGFTEARADRKAIRDETQQGFASTHAAIAENGKRITENGEGIARVEGYLEGSRVSSKSFRPKVVPPEQEPHADPSSELPVAEAA